MQSKLKRNLALALIMLVSAGDCLSQQKTKQPGKQPRPPEIHTESKPRLTPPSGPSFYLEAVADAPNQYSLLLTDTDNRAVAGTFLITQLTIFQALLVAAKEFGETNESAGTTAKPVTTRFRDKSEPAFVVEVQKTATHSRFYVSLSCLAGKITVDAGAIKRGSKDQANPLLFTILSRVNAVIPPSQ
jgi:hypothetical protein